MSLSGLALVLAAAFCHATWNYFVKRLAGGAELIWLFSLVSAILYFPLAMAILVIQKPTFGLWAIFFIVGSAVLHLGYFLLLQLGYSKGALSLVYPTARATGPLISMAFAVVFLNENISPQIILGACIVIIGILGLTGGWRWSAGQAPTSLLFGFAAGCLIGSYTVWDAYTVSVLVVPPLLLDYASSLGRVIMLTPVAGRNRALVRKYWRENRGPVLAIAIFNPLAYILVLYALTFTPVIYVAPLRELSVLLVVLAGSLLLNEGRLLHRLGWSVFILTGVATLLGS